MNKIEIIKEGREYLVINKPAGLVVQEGPGHLEGTLDKMGDWFLVHRLDSGTSGLLLLAKTETAREFFQNQFKNRTVAKKYLALAAGKVEPQNGKINLPIVRHPQKRKTMTISYLNKGKTALTEYQTLKNYGQEATLLGVQIFTGRMHQIRVHLKHLGYPIIGDQTYFNKVSKKLGKKYGLHRQFLHAYYLKFQTPDGSTIELKSDLPEDLQNVLDSLE